MAEVFILGAGFSKEVDESMPLLRDLADAINSRVTLPASVLRLGDNIEMWLNYLAVGHPWLAEAENLRNRALYLDLSREIARTIEECMSPVLKRDCPDWVKEVARWWHEKRASVISFNYDTLVERAVTTVEIIPPDGRPDHMLTSEDIYPISLTPAGARVGAVLGPLRVDSLRLFKLHGSVNWFYSGSTSSFYGETIYYVPPIAWASDVRREVTHKVHTFDKAPMIVPPAIDKTSYFKHETIRSLWSQAGSALHQADRVFCLGYSLPETDVTVRMFLLTNAPDKPVEFHVVNTDASARQHFERLLGDGLYELKVDELGHEPIPALLRSLSREQ